MITLIVYIFIAYGVTKIIVDGEIFESVRNWVGKKSQFFHSIVTCPLCFSTWLGFFLSAILLLTDQETPTTLAFEIPAFSTIFLDGCFTAGIVWTINKLNRE